MGVLRPVTYAACQTGLVLMLGPVPTTIHGTWQHERMCVTSPHAACGHG